MRNHGEVIIDGFGISDVVNSAGLNYRLCNMEAAIAKIQLSKLDELNEKRISLSNRLQNNFKDFDFLKTPVVREGCSHVYYFFTMKYDAEKAGLPRELFTKAVEAEGYVMKSGYVKPIYLEPLYQKKICFGKDGFPFSANDRNEKIEYKKGICPVVERLQDKELIWTSSIYPPLTYEDMDKMACAIKKIIKHKDKLNNL
jgi:dTDP-4-amino-4,6-dideoxygalactose transaminase